MTRNIAVIVLLLTIITACTQESQTSISTSTPTETQIPVKATMPPPTLVKVPIGDGGLISGIPCAAPCFFDIRIGETPLDQVIPTLRSYGISPCELLHDGALCGSQVGISAAESTSIVNRIGYYPSGSISVDMIVEKYGEPDSILVEWDFTGDPSKDARLIVYLLWDTLRMTVILPEIPDTADHTYLVEETTQVHYIDYKDETSYANPPAYGSLWEWQGYDGYPVDVDN